MFELLFLIFAALQAQKMIRGNTLSTKRLPYPSSAVSAERYSCNR